MTQRASKPLSTRLSWDEVHRLEVLMRTRAYAMTSRSGPGTTCPACGGPLGESGMRVAGIRVHPGCLRSVPTD
jgi:hypothetical protein